MPSRRRNQENDDMSTDTMVSEINEEQLTNETSWFSIKNIKTYSYSITKTAFSASKIYLMWVLFHYMAAHMYVYFCAPATLSGLLLSPFLMSAPHCVALRWAIHNGADVVHAMWLILGTWLCSKLLKPN